MNDNDNDKSKTELIQELIELRQRIVHLEVQNNESNKDTSNLVQESQMLHKLIDMLPNLVYIKDVQSHFLFINDAVRRHLGANSVEEVIGKTDFDFSPPEMAAQYYAQEQKIFESGQALADHEELILDRETETTRWVLTTKVPFWDDQDNIAGLIGLNRDITKRKQAQIELDDYRNHLEDRMAEYTGDLLEANTLLQQEINERLLAEKNLKEKEDDLKRAQTLARMGSWDWNKINNRVFWSDELYRIFGYEPQAFEPTFESFLNMVHPDDRASHINRDLETQAGKESFNTYSYCIIRPDGKERIVEANLATFFDEAGQLARVVGSILDITERKQAEEALKAYSERLEEMVHERTQKLQDAQEQLIRKEKLAILGQLAGGVGHELRNPMGVISNAIYFLQMILAEADDQIKEYLDIIAAKVTEAERIVTALLDLARTKSERKDVILSELITEVLQQYPPPENIEFQDNISANLPPVFVNSQQIKQVLINLVSNAYQAMPQGGTLILAAQAKSTQIHFSLSDTGYGMSAKTLEKVFEPLFTTRVKGIGLGLAISKNLVELNEGHIEASSVEGQGSMFSVTLPVRLNS